MARHLGLRRVYKLAKLGAITFEDREASLSEPLSGGYADG